MRLEQLLDEFRFNWAKSMAEEVADGEKGKHQGELLCALRDFTSAIDQTVIKETAALVAGFQPVPLRNDKMVDKGNK